MKSYSLWVAKDGRCAYLWFIAYNKSSYTYVFVRETMHHSKIEKVPPEINFYLSKALREYYREIK